MAARWRRGSRSRPADAGAQVCYLQVLDLDDLDDLDHLADIAAAVLPQV